VFGGAAGTSTVTPGAGGAPTIGVPGGGGANTTPIAGNGGTSLGGAPPVGGTAGSTSDGGSPTGGGSTDLGGAAGTAGAAMTGDAPTMQSASSAGTYKVVTYTSGYKDGANFADATVHYPSDATPPFPIVAVVPGFVSPQSSIQAWGPFLASHGIVTMTIGTNSPADPPATRELALMDAIDSLIAENTRQDGPLMGKLDVTKKATMGWSMGGGGTLLAANDHPDLKASISMCGWNPGVTYPKDTVPTLMFAATADPLAGGQSQGFYASIPMTTPKELYEVNGGSHFIANDPANENKQIGLYGLSWLEVYLVGDTRYEQFLTVMPMNSSTFTNNLM
jgi:dienelactone hydrolase